jgi:hypothetical protein
MRLPFPLAVLERENSDGVAYECILVRECSKSEMTLSLLKVNGVKAIA